MIYSVDARLLAPIIPPEKTNEFVSDWDVGSIS